MDDFGSDAPHISAMSILETLGLGGGCHWCTEAVFQALRGVETVEQGFIAAEPPDDALSEAIRLQFDEEMTPLDVLLEIHLRTHASASNHTMRGKYRSAVYTEDDMMAERCRNVLDRLAGAFEKPLVTRVLSLERFVLNDERFLNYRGSRPEAPFCKTYIDPKLALLRQDFAVYTDETD